MIGIGARTVYNASVTTVSTNSQDDWSIVHYYLQVEIPKTGTGHHCSPAHIETQNYSGPPHERSHFKLKYAFTSLTRCDQPTPPSANTRPWHRNRRGNTSVTMQRVRSKLFLKNRQNYNLVLPRKSGWAIGRLGCPAEWFPRADWQHRFLMTGCDPSIHALS